MNGQIILIGYFFIINVVAFVMMGVDKKRARQGKWRISEKNLWVAALLGGTVGGLLGMKRFRHKTKHRSFTFGFPLLFIFQTVFIYYLVQMIAS